MTIAEAQLEMRRRFAGGFYGQFVSGVLWLLSAGVAYIDSSGVGMMAAKLKQVRTQGGDVRLLHLTSRSQRLLGMMKLVTVFETFDDEQAAVRSFSARPGQ